MHPPPEIHNLSDINENPIDELTPSRRVQFWTILVFECPSLLCTIFLLYHLLSEKRLREALHNHVIIILLFLCLIIEIFDNPLYLDSYLHYGRNSFPSSSTVCLIWWFIDYGVYGAIIVFLAWGSFERHILIFHHKRFLRTKSKIMIFHYLPLIIISIYSLGFYIVVIVFPPCENTFDFESEACGASPCYESLSWLNIWDYFINGAVCILIEGTCSISLLIRVTCRRTRAQRRLHWRKHRRMTIQLLSITTLSMFITLPQSLITIIQQTIPGMESFASNVNDWLFYLTTFVVLFMPFVSLGCLTELWSKLFLCKNCRERKISPINFIQPRTRVNAVPLPTVR